MEAVHDVILVISGKHILLVKFCQQFWHHLAEKFLLTTSFATKNSNFLRKSESITKSDVEEKKKKKRKKRKPRRIERRLNGNKKRFSSFL